LVFCQDISSFGSVKFHPISAQSTKYQNCILRQHIQQIYDLSKFYLQARNLQPVLLQNREDYRTQSIMIQFENYGKMPCLPL